MHTLAELLLMSFIVNLGVAFGAGLYETIIVIPLWFPETTENGYRVNTEAMQNVDTGRKFWAFVTTLPLTLFTFASLLVAWQSVSPGRIWWMMAALIALIERAATFTYFIPTIIKLQKADRLPTTMASRSVAVWINVNYLRNALTLLAWLLALQALAV